MTSEFLDPRRERLIAALYGELSSPEREAFEAELERDEELRAEWEELSSTRSFLQAAVDEQPAPQFVFLAPPGAARDEPAAHRSSGRRFWSSPRGPALGFALAAASLVVMLVLGLRVDRIPGGLWVHFGNAPDSAPVSLPIGEGRLAEGIPIEPNASHPAPAQFVGGPMTEMVSGQTAAAGSYLTHAEFATYSSQIMELMANGLSDYENRRQRELRRVLRGVYQDFDERQQLNRQEIGAEFERAWLRLLESSQQSVEPGSNLPVSGARGSRPTSPPSFPGNAPGNGN